jgi:hypothetical protein
MNDEWHIVPYLRNYGRLPDQAIDVFTKRMKAKKIQSISIIGHYLAGLNRVV